MSGKDRRKQERREDCQEKKKGERGKRENKPTPGRPCYFPIVQMDPVARNVQLAAYTTQFSHSFPGQRLSGGEKQRKLKTGMQR